MLFKKKDQEDVKGYANYSGLAFQMVAVIGLAVWGGMYLDKKMNLSQPYFTIALTLMGVVGMMISVIRKFLPKDKSKE